MIKTYTVHSPPEDNRPEDDRVMDYIFIKEGYSIWAALLGPFWTLANGMWMETGVYIGGLIVGSILMEVIGFNAGAIGAAILFANLIFGLFARDLQRFFYERQGYTLETVVNGKSYQDCEVRYFRQREKQTKTTTPPPPEQEAPAL